MKANWGNLTDEMAKKQGQLNRLKRDFKSRKKSKNVFEISIIKSLLYKELILGDV